MEHVNQTGLGRDDKGKDFVPLLTSQQARIYNYILSLVPNFNDADDILQDTTRLMWEKFDEFEVGTDFLAWSKKIAYFLVLQYYRKKKKENAFLFDKQLLAKLDYNINKFSDSSKDYQVHLKGCINKLKESDIKLLNLKYFKNQSVKELAVRYGCSVQYIYRNISRIHQLLIACIQKQISFACKESN